MESLRSRLVRRRRRSRRLALGVLAVALAATGLTYSSLVSASTATFTATADAYVTAASPSSNFGSASDLRAASSPETRSYLAFSLSGLSNVATVTLRVWANQASSTGFDVRSVSAANWKEGSIKYNNAPGVGGIVGSSGSLSAGSWASVDVTPAISGNGTLSLALTSSTSTAVSLGSRESANKPQLVVEMSGDTTPPVISLAQPANGSATTGTTPTFSGVAGADTGDSPSVAVKIYSGPSAGGSLVQSLSTSRKQNNSYSVKASSALPQGTYTAQAEQSDNAGNVGKSSANTFRIDTSAPTVTLTSPANGSTTTAAPTFGGIGGTADGDSASVTVRVYAGTGTGGTLRQTLSASVGAGGAYLVAASSPLAAGTYTAQAQQTDDVGHTGTSSTTTFTVDATAPVVTLVQPATGSTAADSTPTFSGTGGTAPGDIRTVTVKVYSGASVSGSPVQTRSATVGAGGAYSVAASPALTDGTYTAQAEQSDGAGNVGYSTANTFTISTDVTPPSVTLSQPADGSSTSESTPAFSGTGGTAAGDSATVTVKVYSGASVGGSPVQTRSATVGAGGAYSVAASPALTEGTYTAQAEQIDGAGNVGYSAANTFTVDVTAPALTLATPANGSLGNNSTPTFSGTAGDAAGDSASVTVVVYRGVGTGGSIVETLSASRSATSWSVDASPALADDTYTAVATQSDAAGNTTATSPSTFTISTAAPLTYKDVVLVDNPVAYWRFGESSGTTAVDEVGRSGTKPNGTSPGAYHGGLTLGQSGAIVSDADTAARFNGTSANVTAAGSGTPTSPLNGAVPDPITLEVWVKRGSLSTEQRIFAKNTGWLVLDFTATNKVRLGISGGTGDIAVSTVTVTDTTNWHHIVATKDGATAHIYIDGVDVTGPVSNQTPIATSNSLYIGSQYGGGGRWFNGLLDEPAIYLTALDASRVQAHYEKGKPPASDTAPPLVTLAVPAAGAAVADSTPTFSGQSGTDLGDQPTVTVRIYSGGSATGSPVRTATATPGVGGAYAVDSSPPLANGTYTAQAEQSDSHGNIGTSSAVTFTIAAPTYPVGDPVVLTAGDIARCDFPEGPASTSALLDDPADAIVATLGDHAYSSGTLSEFNNCYDPTWGHVKNRTRPILGEHEYQTPNAAGYFSYFHDQLAPFGPDALDPAQGWYSYDVGTWHVVALNSAICEDGLCHPDSPETLWLQSDLAAHANQCTLALSYAFRFSSGTVHAGEGSNTRYLFQTLYNAGVDAIVSGDDHEYERFAPQDPNASLDLAGGISQFIAGTGGGFLYSFDSAQPNSEVRDNGSYGVLKLTLHAGSYEWEFKPAAPGGFHDYGSRTCH
jgi:hypothetical protein